MECLYGYICVVVCGTIISGASRSVCLNCLARYVCVLKFLNWEDKPFGMTRVIWNIVSKWLPVQH